MLQARFPRGACGAGRPSTPRGGTPMRRSTRLATGLCALSILALVASASLNGGEKGKIMLKAGDKAPAFEGVDENGKPWKSTDHVGKKVVVVFFFPAALTGG